MDTLIYLCLISKDNIHHISRLANHVNSKSMRIKQYVNLHCRRKKLNKDKDNPSLIQLHKDQQKDLLRCTMKSNVLLHKATVSKLQLPE